MARYEVRRGVGPTPPSPDVFHLSTPAARWWRHGLTGPFWQVAAR